MNKKKVANSGGVAVVKPPFNLSEFLLNYSLYIVLGAMILVVIILEPTFVSLNNFTNILTQASTRGIMALGVAGLIVLQGTDLSAGRILAVTGAVSASLLQNVDYLQRMYPNLPELPWFVPLFIAMAIGAIFGLINGFGVAVLKLHAFIITLGTQLIAFGVLCLYIESQANGAQPIGSLNDTYRGIVTGAFYFGKQGVTLSDNADVFVKLPFLILYLAATAGIMWVVWNKTKLGKNMFAIGGNPEAAAVSGVNIVKNIIAIFIISGVLYGVAGYLEAARIGSVNTALGINYELDAISACVVGGVSFMGGVGTIPGVLIGTVILQFINYGLNFIGVSPYYQYIIKGLIIILAVSIDVRKYLVKK